jgi:hypothetical protein
VRSAEGKAIACQSTEGLRRLERSGRHLRGGIDQSGGRLNVDNELPAQYDASQKDPPLTWVGSESRSAAGSYPYATAIALPPRAACHCETRGLRVCRRNGGRCLL